MKRGRLALVTGPQLDYCDRYHCPGDCGLPHNSVERAAYARHMLATLDALEAEDRRKRLDAKQDVRSQAKDRL